MDQGRAITLGLALCLAGPASAVEAATTERVSVTDTEKQANGLSVDASVSGDGRFVAFTTEAANLGAVPNVSRVLVRDRTAGTTRPADLSPGGAAPNGFVAGPAISRDGGRIAFTSIASNLVPGDTSAFQQAYVRDLAAAATTRASVKSSGVSAKNGDSFAEAVSANGRYVAFSSDARNITGLPTRVRNMFVRDLTKGRTTLESPVVGGGAGSAEFKASLSKDGRLLAFWSYADDLVAGDANGQGDVFVRDRQTGTTVLASVATDGTQGDSVSSRPRIANDGAVVAFDSRTENLVPGRTRGDTYVYARDLAAGTTTRVSVTASGGVPNAPCYLGGVSASGRWVVFASEASDIVPGDTNGKSDIFLRDRQAGTTVRVSLAAAGAQANGDSFAPAISADGRVIAFQSDATNLVPGDTNGAFDVFVRVLD